MSLAVLDLGIETLVRSGVRYYRRAGSPRLYPSVTSILGGWGSSQLIRWARERTADVIRCRLLQRLGEPVTEALADEVAAFREADFAREAALGSRVHEGIWRLLSGELRAADPETEPLVRAAADWLEETGAEPAMAEVPVLSERFGFGGTVDALLQLPDGTSLLVDWKTGEPRVTHALQLAAYWQACEETGIDVSEAWAVYLRTDGWHARRLRDRKEAFDAFVDVLRAWRELQFLPERWLE